MPEIINRDAKKLLSQIERIESNVNKIVNKIVASSESATVFWTRLQVDLRASYRKARKDFKDWSDVGITSYYNQFLTEELHRVNSMKIMKNRKVNISEFLNTDKNKQIVNSIKDESNASFLSGLNAGEKEMLRLVAYSQQANANEFVSEFITNEIKRLKAKAQDGKFIKLIDKNGKERFYNLKDYTELTIRTKLREASTAGVINTANNLNTDLVQVSAHNTLTAFDAQFEGKIYSLSGSDPDFPQATFLPPFHPNCLHFITIIFRETLQQRGIQKYIDFSQGVSDIHPTRKSFIPLNEREFAA
jgi:hypothetical protein